MEARGQRRLPAPQGRLTRCLNGLVKRRHEDLAIRIVGRAEQPLAVARLVAGKFTCPTAERPEIEILFLPGEGRFTGEADCNVVVALEPAAARSRLARQADLTILPFESDGGRSTRLVPQQFDQELRKVA